MSSLADQEKKTLLEIARRAATSAVQGDKLPEVYYEAANQPALARPAGVFVTLLLRGRLRGCIGQLESDAPLAEVVDHCARAVTHEDTRFRPVPPQELSQIEIEISVLSSPETMTPDEIQIGTHGLLVTNGEHRALLLPQVATQFRWNALRFLEETCEKAGLPRDAWKLPTTRIEAFTAEVFDEKDMAGR
jgi:AmmeMemoRadiSam system protein A